MIWELIFNLFLIIFLFYIFNLNKTSYILGYSVMIFIISFIYFIYLGFEFIALTFMITYIGGIAVMFLFLILVLDVNSENTKRKPIFSISTFYLIFITLMIVLCATKLIQSVYNPFIFNSIEFYEFIIESLIETLENKVIFTEQTISNLFNISYEQNYFAYKMSLEYLCNQAFTLLEHQAVSKYLTKNEFSNFLVINIWESSIINFSDIVSFGMIIYQTNSLLLGLIAFFLLIALIISIYIGSGIFQLEKF